MQRLLEGLVHGYVQHGAANAGKGADVEVELGTGQNFSCYAFLYVRRPDCSMVRKRKHSTVTADNILRLSVESPCMRVCISGIPRVYLTFGGGFLRWRSLIDAIQSVIFFGWGKRQSSETACDIKEAMESVLAGWHSRRY
jgi:hypothetical protein